MSSLNPAIERALQRQLQKDPPFSERDVASVVALGVLCPVDIADLARLTNLRTLILVGYGDRDLTPLADLPIGSLEIRLSGVDSLEVIANLPRLRILKVKNNAIVEIDALAEGQHRLVELDLTGNPLSDRAYREVAPRLRERFPGLRMSDDREWRLTRRLYAAGLPFDYYRDNETYWLCRPGLAYTGLPDANHLKIDPDVLEELLDRDPAEIPRLFPDDES